MPAVDWTIQNRWLLLPLVALAAALWLLMPRLAERRSWRIAGGVLAMAGLAGAGVGWIRLSGDPVHDLLFYILAGVAAGSGLLMVTNRNPVYAALWFALTTLSVCGLFLLRSAPFLAAATVIVYAGAIIVVFLFVLMLAQQSGLAVYDRRAVQPLPAIAVMLLLMGAVLVSLPSRQETIKLASKTTETVVDSGVEVANPLSRPAEGEFGTMRGLGRSLFGDYLFTVELAGTLLMIACIGAIAISPRRSRGGL